MPLYQLEDSLDIVAPTLIAALDGWVDAGTAATTAAAQLVVDGEIVAMFDSDALFDYRSRRPTLDIIDGRPAEITWPELAVRRQRIEGRDVLVLSGHEPDLRWRELATAAVELARRLGVVEWISLGAIPAAVPHTRPVPILGTESRPGLLRGDVQPGPEGLLRVPSAAISVLDFTIARSGIPAVGYYAQIPHYVTGPYPAASIELLHSVERHLGQDVPLGSLVDTARLLRTQLDAATSADQGTRQYVERLETMVDEARLPLGGRSHLGNRALPA